MQIFFEEANKVLGGVESAKRSDDTGGADTSYRSKHPILAGRRHLGLLCRQQQNSTNRPYELDTPALTDVDWSLDSHARCRES